MLEFLETHWRELVELVFVSGLWFYKNRQKLSMEYGLEVMRELLIDHKKLKRGKPSTDEPNGEPELKLDALKDKLKQMESAMEKELPKQVKDAVLDSLESRDSRGFKVGSINGKAIRIDPLKGLLRWLK